MLSVLSPAKTLDFETPPTTRTHTLPDYLDASQALIRQLRDYSPQQLAELMQISDKLAGLNAARFAEWHPGFTPENAKQAVQAFQGDVYVGLAADQWNENQLAWSQDHLRILSGLYGLLRPLDLIQPYRLEMGTKLANEAGRDLYAFWRDTLTPALAADVEASGSPVLVNLASNEYFKAIDERRFPHRIITPVFKDYKNGRYKVISFHAKKARGWMSAWMVRQQADDPETLKQFDTGGYRFNPDLSEGDQWVFTRDAA
ncbi:hypothetical protein C7446_1759 [Kushneria sinocarnis]|uniref:UPF0246 protein C7446_1759 n=1 Tax=Kushneria sinocarnis TaxID=595502 RepID=A0A420WXR7_9GAMM|nr:peroxide stress protein YaaA [Kushneria sinocarnis]RKR04549.1 hypothetical protein C7446_1759 [Kushneria sinocarnis]